MGATKSSLAIKIKAPGRSGCRPDRERQRLSACVFVLVSLSLSSVFLFRSAYVRVCAYVSCFMRVNVTVFIHLLKDYESNLNSAKARRRVIFHVLPEIKAIFYSIRARPKLKFSRGFWFFFF